MTYDERQEIAEYLDIVKKNAQRLLHSVELMQDSLGEMKCELSKNNKESESTKENFLKNY